MGATTRTGSANNAARIASIKAASMRLVIGGIALPNEASIRLQERLGFKKVGFKYEQCVDVSYWQLLL